MYNLKIQNQPKPLLKWTLGKTLDRALSQNPAQKNAHVEIPRMSDFGRYWQFDDINMDDIDER